MGFAGPSRYPLFPRWGAVSRHGIGDHVLMFNKIKAQIDNIKAERSYIDAEWDAEKDKALLSFYVKIMPKMLDAERCSIFIYDPESKTIWLKGGTEVKERDIEVTGEYDSVVGNVITTGKYRIVDRLNEKNGIHKEMDERTGFKTRNILCIPIWSLDGKKVVGAVQILNKKDGKAFNDEDRILLEEMAHFLELTIESIYMSQKTAGVLDAVFGLLGKIALFAIATVIFIVTALSIYWIVLYFMVK